MGYEDKVISIATGLPHPLKFKKNRLLHLLARDTGVLGDNRPNMTLKNVQVHSAKRSRTLCKKIKSFFEKVLDLFAERCGMLLGTMLSPSLLTRDDQTYRSLESR